MGRNRERILESAIEQFNRSGTVATTTNHISAELGISPGNLYFHFRNKEEIIRELFGRMCQETYERWNVERSLAPLELIQDSFSTLWKYRFFHREMYHLRRCDPELSRLWRRHLKMCLRLLKSHYARWVRSELTITVKDPKEMQQIFDSVLLFASSSLNFFESPERPASRQPLQAGGEYLIRLLWPYFSIEYKRQLKAVNEPGNLRV